MWPSTMFRSICALIALGIAAFCAAPPCAHAAVVLMVTDQSSSLTSEESARKAQFEAWGHTVNTIWDADSQANFDTALSAAEVAYVPFPCQAGELGYKLREAEIGVVFEKTDLDIVFGFSNSVGTGQFTNAIVITDDSHQVTSGLSTGSLAIYSSSNWVGRMQGSIASGVNPLATVSGSVCLATAEKDAALINSHNGSNLASGRRVRLPFGGNAFNWSSITADGLTLVQNAIDWSASSGGVDAAVYSASNPGELDDIDWNSTPLLTFTDLQINYPSTNGELLPGAPNNHFGVRFTGEVFIPSDGTWTFYTNSDDGSKLFINGSEVVDNDGLHGMRERDGTISLTTGWHAIQVDVFERGGGVGIIASWEGPGVSKEVIPQGSLRGGDAINLSPVAHWALDDNSGSTATDSSQTANDGTLNNSPTWTSDGVYSGALQFDGSNDYVEVPHDDAYLADNGTVTFWFKANDLNGRQGLFSKDSSGFDTGGHLTIYLDGSRLRVRQQSSSQSSEIESDTLVPEVWYFVVYQFGEDGQRLVINKQEEDTDTSFTSGLGSTSGGTGNFEPIGIGVNTWSSGNLTLSSLRDYFDGSMDEVRFYSRRITDEEIAALYGLRGQWLFNDGSGSVAADNSGNGNDGALQGDAAFVTSCNGSPAIGLDGTGDYVEVPDSASMRFSGDATLTGWFKLDSNFDSSTPTAFLADKFLNGRSNMHLALAGSDYNRSYVPKGALVFKLENRGAGYNWTTTESWKGGIWTHLAVVYEENDRRNMRVYIDGTLDTSTSRRGGGSREGYDFAAQFRIGGLRNERVQNRTFPGEMYDWRLYSRALDEAEIRELAGKILHWKFDETSGLTATDSTGNGYDGDVQAAADWVNGQVDGAIELHGDNGSLRGIVQNVPVAGALNGLDEFTVSVWVNSDELDVDRGIFCGEQPQGSDDILALRYDEQGANTRNDSLLKAALRTTDGHQQIETDSNTQSTGWQHLVLVWTSGQDLQLYIDGSLANVDYRGAALGGTVSGITDLRVGIGVKNQNWNGLIDDFRVYRRALCPSEIAALSDQTPGTGLRIIRWVEVANP